MSGIKHITLLTTAWLLAATACPADVISRISTRFLARGEQALLEVAVTGSQPTAMPRIPAVNGVEIQPTGRGIVPKMLPGRKLEYVLEFVVSSFAVGRHVLPAFDVETGGVKTRTEPLEFVVFNPDELQWSEAEVGGTRFRYASSFRAMNTIPYEGETTPVEIKLYVPADLNVDEAGWGIPDFQRDGLTAWRFQPSAMRGQVNLLGRPHVSVAYPSTITPTRSGKVAIGPATIRLITIQRVLDGFMRLVHQELNVSVPKLELESTPLPKGAPEGFENAVGSFRLDVSTTMREAQEGDPIPVDILVSGSGNLDTLRAPKPVDSSGWKAYDATTDLRGDERRELSGTTVFRQFLRPLELKPALPSYRLVYFDPKDKGYKTLTSEPITLKLKPLPATRPAALEAPQSLSVPVERMTDILGMLRTDKLTTQAPSGLPGWFWHALGGLLALILIAKALWMRNAHRFQKDPIRDARIKELRELENVRTGDDAGFLMAAGRFVERWLGSNPAPEVKAVLETRDSLCFRGERPGSGVLEPKRRDDILRALRKAAMLWTAFILLETGTHTARAESIAQQAHSAYDTARYDDAIALWLKAGNYQDLSADTLYNIGNACYRAGSPGHAALYYRRAISRAPGHQEALQNLRFIERKHGSISINRPDYQYALARLPLATWRNFVWIGAWLFVLAVLMFPATRSGSRLRIAAFAALLTAPLVATCGALGWRYYPDDAEFAPLSRQAVVIADKAVLHAEAARTSPEVIDAPPGSLCEIIRQSGRWAYVAFATKTRGWIQMESIEKLIPTTPPSPPTIRKPKVDGKSA
jgi:tetratricopeptide (TPR) repeat protein